MYDFGSIALVPHTLLSTRRHFRNAGLGGSRPSRTYSGLSGEWGKQCSGVPCPNSQQARRHHRVEGVARIVHIPPRRIYCRAGRESRVKTCRGHGVVARPGKSVKTWGPPSSGGGRWEGMGMIGSLACSMRRRNTAAEAPWVVAGQVRRSIYVAAAACGAYVIGRAMRTHIVQLTQSTRVSGPAEVHILVGL